MKSSWNSDSAPPATTADHPGFFSQLQADGETFFRYLYRYTLQDSGYLMFLLAAINLLLLIPDMMRISSIPGKVFIIFFRLILSAGILVFYFFLDRFGTFRNYSRALTLVELFACFVFLFALSFTAKPDFMLQSIGMILLFIIFFMLPNNSLYVVAISFFSFCVFLLLCAFRIEDLTQARLFAGAALVLIAGGLCAFGARSTERYRMRHFSSLEALRSISTTDPLTKTDNRIRLERDGEKWMKLCRAHHQPLSLAFLDLDNLKEINDTHGHLIGDKVLVETAIRARTHLTSRDIVCRWGGDEFIILLPGLDIRKAALLMEKIRNELLLTPFEQNIRTSCSFGIAQMKEDSTLHSLISLADKQMYAAKRKGKNRIEY